LHSSVRNQCNLVFNVLQEKKVKNNSHAFHYQCFAQTLLHHDLGFNPRNCRNSPPRNMVFFKDLLRHEVKKRNF